MAYPTEQLKYMGGGHPGCGGYCELLRITLLNPPKEWNAPVQSLHVLHEYRVDADGARHRWMPVAPSEIENVWEIAYLLCTDVHSDSSNWSEWISAAAGGPWWSQIDDASCAPRGHDLICEHCDKDIPRPGSVLIGGHGVFCSLSCAADAHVQNQKRGGYGTVNKH